MGGFWADAHRHRTTRLIIIRLLAGLRNYSAPHDGEFFVGWLCCALFQCRALAVNFTNNRTGVQFVRNLMSSEEFPSARCLGSSPGRCCYWRCLGCCSSVTNVKSNNNSHRVFPSPLPGSGTPSADPLSEPNPALVRSLLCNCNFASQFRCWQYGKVLFIYFPPLGGKSPSRSQSEDSRDSDVGV